VLSREVADDDELTTAFWFWLRDRWSNAVLVGRLRVRGDAAVQARPSFAVRACYGVASPWIGDFGQNSAAGARPWNLALHQKSANSPHKKLHELRTNRHMQKTAAEAKTRKTDWVDQFRAFTLPNYAIFLCRYLPGMGCGRPCDHNMISVFQPLPGEVVNHSLVFHGAFGQNVQETLKSSDQDADTA
jgi:hypothetical protein